MLEHAKDISKMSEEKMWEYLTFYEKFPYGVQYCDYLRMVKNIGLGLRYIPPNVKNEELCLEAIKQNNSAIIYVPKILLTQEMCDLAIHGYPWFLPEMPNKFITQNIIHSAFTNKKYSQQHFWNYGYNWMEHCKSGKLSNRVWELLIVETEQAYAHIKTPNKKLTELHKMLWEV